MDPAQRIRQLGDWLAGTDIAVLELDTPDGRIRLDRSAAAKSTASAPSAPSAPSAAPPGPAPARRHDDARVVRASSVGIFLDTHPLAGTPVAALGARVVAGQTLGLLRIGALLLPVVAPADGVVRRVLATPGAAVGYGDALFELR